MPLSNSTNVLAATKGVQCSWCGRTSKRRKGDHPRCVRERRLAEKVMLYRGEEWTEAQIAKALRLTQQAVNVIIKRAVERAAQTQTGRDA